MPGSRRRIGTIEIRSKLITRILPDWLGRDYDVFKGVKEGIRAKKRGRYILPLRSYSCSRTSHSNEHWKMCEMVLLETRRALYPRKGNAGSEYIWTCHNAEHIIFTFARACAHAQAFVRVFQCVTSSDAHSHADRLLLLFLKKSWRKRRKEEQLKCSPPTVTNVSQTGI